MKWPEFFTEEQLAYADYLLVDAPVMKLEKTDEENKAFYIAQWQRENRSQY